MATLTVERLREGGAAMVEELTREYYLVGAGLQAEPGVESIYARWAHLTGPDAMQLALEAHAEAASGSREDQRRARMLLDWAAEHRVGRALAPLEDRELAWEASAVVQVTDGRQVEFQRAAIDIANARDRDDRLALERARYATIAEGLAPLRRERLARERDLTESFGLGAGYNATFEVLSGVALAPLAAQCRAFLSDTSAMWEDLSGSFIRKALAIEPREATRGDALALFRAPEVDRFFPGRDMESRIMGQVREMGIDPLANGRVRVDLADRPGKRSRAFCAPVRIPQEVHLVLRPHGGRGDWTTFLHELGHALHYANVADGLPFEFRWLGDNSITESYAMLFDHLMQDAGWLRRYTDLGRPELADFRRRAAFEELHLLRRYCAKFLYEVQLHGGDVSWPAAPDLFVQELTAATGFQYDRAEAFVDLDVRYYSARYLRAWQLQALVAATLTSNFNEDWWRNPRAGPWIVEALFAHGQREMGDELAERVAGASLGFAPVVRAIESAFA